MVSIDKFKLSSVTWDSDKNPTGFTKWMNDFGSLVASTEHGAILEAFLDQKLGREKHLATTVPSYISKDDDFAAGEDPEEEPEVPAEGAEAPEAEAQEVVSSSGPPKMGRGLLRAKKKYADFTAEEKALDGMLYNVLKMNVKGTKNEMLRHVSFPSYVQGMCVLFKHVDICAVGRKTIAFEKMDQLQFKGDIQSYQIDAINAIQELFDSKANIVDYALSKVMKSFEGRSKTIQFRIADDINNTSDTSTLNIFDMIQSYCADIAAVGDGKSKPTRQVSEVPKCSHCGKKGHEAKDCFQLHPEKKTRSRRSGNESKGDEPCKRPGHSGHSAKDCIQAKKERKAKKQQKSSSKVSLAKSSLSQMIEKIEKGSYRTNHVVAQAKKSDLPKEGIVLSLCDGMGCAARVLQDLDMAPSHYIGVEINAASKKIAQNLNPATSRFKGIDHSRFSDVMKITRSDISELGQGAIDKVFFGAPCEDFSFLRLLPNRQGKLPPQGSNPRPGLDGPKGRILRQCIKILTWVLEFNPPALHFVEMWISRT